ncbi:MAG: cytochrome C oxidase subunit IV family protein [Acidobacteriota bacterium]|nr:cytochrome C oxidase subunit IV family protein [Acidobacteriota bacterium]
MGHDRKMGHVQSPKVYLGVLLGLFVLTVATVAVSYLDLGVLNDVVAIAVASCKATLVILFFMHGRFEDRITWAFIWYPLVLVGLLLGGVFLDYANRVTSMQDVMTPISAVETAGEAGDHKEEKADDGEEQKDESQDESNY